MDEFDYLCSLYTLLNRSTANYNDWSSLNMQTHPRLCFKVVEFEIFFLEVFYVCWGAVTWRNPYFTVIQWNVIWKTNFYYILISRVVNFPVYCVKRYRDHNAPQTHKILKMKSLIQQTVLTKMKIVTFL